MKKISQYFLTFSTTLFIGFILTSFPVKASLSVLTEGLPRFYKATEKSIFELDGATQVISDAFIQFEGAELKKGHLNFSENKKNWVKINFEDAKLVAEDGTFRAHGELKLKEGKTDLVIYLYLEPTKNGFNGELRKLIIDKKEFVIKKSKLIFLKQ